MPVSVYIQSNNSDVIVRINPIVNCIKVTAGLASAGQLLCSHWWIRLGSQALVRKVVQRLVFQRKKLTRGHNGNCFNFLCRVPLIQKLLSSLGSITMSSEKCDSRFGKILGNLSLTSRWSICLLYTVNCIDDADLYFILAFTHSLGCDHVKSQRF